MAKRPSISTVTSGFQSGTTINDNFTALRDGFDNTLSLDGSAPNAMGADLDMNSNDILNAGALNVGVLRINGESVLPTNVVGYETDVKYDFKSVSQLVADIKTYTYFAAGDYVKAGGHRYEVAASGATDHHVTTAGGVKLYVLPNVAGARSLAAAGADTTGTVDASSRLAILWEVGPVYIDGNFRVSSSISQTATHDLVFAQGGRITVDSTRTLTVRGQIVAGDAPIFFGAGTVNLNEGPRYFNIGWFDGADLSEKWNFCRRGFLDLYWYNIYLPMPSDLDPAADFDLSGGQRRYYWKLAAPLQFDDPENRSTITLSGQIKATAAMSDMMIFSPSTGKTEDIEFLGRVELIGNGLVTNSGVLYRGAARVNFNHLNINEVPYGCDFLAVLPHSYIHISYLYTGLLTASAVRFRDDVDGITGINIVNLEGARFSGATCSMVEFEGDIRNVRIGSISYLTDGGSNLQQIVKLTGNSLGRPRYITIGQCYANNAEVGVYARLLTGSSRIEGISIGPITTNISVSGKLALDLEWVGDSTFYLANRIDSASVGDQCFRVNVMGRNGSLTRPGSTSYIMTNGAMTQPLATNTRPSLTDVMLGEVVFDSARGGAWQRVSATGDANVDFIPVGGIIVGQNSPEGVITARVGTIFQRINGGAGTSIYVKESGTGNTGWVAK